MKFFVLIIAFVTKATIIPNAVRTNRFCVNCIHYIKNPEFADLSYGRCKRFPNPITTYIDPVTGEEKTTFEETFYKRFEHCKIVRKDPNKCGPTGKFFERAIIESEIDTSPLTDSFEN